jgi:hypothetical protein
VPDDLLAEIVVRLPYIISFVPLVAAALVYWYILFHFRPERFHADVLDVALCFHINEYLCTPRGRMLKTLIRALAYLGILVLVIGKSDEAVLLRAAPQLILAVSGVTKLFDCSPVNITFGEYRCVTHTANNQSPGAYKAQPLSRTIWKEMLAVIELEAMKANEAVDLDQLLGGAEPADDSSKPVVDDAQTLQSV